MAADKRKFVQSCIKEVQKENIVKKRRILTPILKRRYTTTALPLSPRQANIISPRKLFDSPKKHQTNPMKTRIHFDNKVRVIHIPSHDQYPESMKSSIWSNSAEIRRNARRNTIEFAAEGRDWRKACEDFYIAANGQSKIHPVHVLRFINRSVLYKLRKVLDSRHS